MLTSDQGAAVHILGYRLLYLLELIINNSVIFPCSSGGVTTHCDCAAGWADDGRYLHPCRAELSGVRWLRRRSASVGQGRTRYRTLL